ncbi:protein PHLOEM PROTEIN 2-LIKE A1-like [Vicia villosa]|uniref:protein PHLOEM PROTEIN 2-LIKE A1-like n=1 Tax=Vicia villosa TaxID=3911 RepID=UPI00273AC331|nr:protein PHLOEM PROTEIN 2-LIKE A1-like [Vicia villosa]
MGANLSELEQQQQQQPEQQPQTHHHSQSQPRQNLHQPNEPTNKEEFRSPSRSENLLLSPRKSTEPSRKVVQNGPVVKAKYETQSAASKPLIKELSFPHNYENILKDADSPVNKSSREKMFDQLNAGVFLHRKTKKYWVEKKSKANCFMLYARALSITWAENPLYWEWKQQKDASDGMTEVAELVSVCWLEVHGKFDTRKLSPGILYQVLFCVKLIDPAQGWELPVNVRLVLPGGKKQQYKMNLMEMLRGRWIEVPVGEFVASEKDGGEMEISMFEYEGGMWKQGLVIKGIAIKPKE